jgi:8-oxo-dGTP diphosphatase
MLPRHPNQGPSSPTPNPRSPIPTLGVRTVVVLFHGDKMLLLRRASWKKFAPNRWTGLGGNVEPAELSDLESAAWRELFEETDLSTDEVSDFRLYRTLFFHHPVESFVCLLYFAGQTSTDRVPACTEGSLHWVSPEDVAGLDLIENTAQVLPLLVEDVRRSERGVHCGVASYDETGHLLGIVWESATTPLAP